MSLERVATADADHETDRRSPRSHRLVDRGSWLVVAGIGRWLVAAWWGLARARGWRNCDALGREPRRPRRRAAYEHGEWERAADLARQLLKTRPATTPRRCGSTRGRRPGWSATDGRRDLRRPAGARRAEPEDSFLLGLTLVRAGKLGAGTRGLGTRR